LELCALRIIQRGKAIDLPDACSGGDLAIAAFQVAKETA